jgi:hypothetical protein
MSLLRLVAPLALSVVLVPAVARADGEPLPPRTVGVDGAVVLPLGDYGKVATLAFGPLVRLEFPVIQHLAITARAGVLYHILDGDVDGTLWFIPAYGGVRYSFGEAGQGAYLAGELGITFAYATSNGFSDSDSKLGGTFGGGFRKGALDLHGALFIPDLGHADDLGLMASVGFDFSRF